MTTNLAFLTTTLLIVAIGWLLVRTIRDDRPVNPPGSPLDWREQQLGDWRQLWIR